MLNYLLSALTLSMLALPVLAAVCLILAVLTHAVVRAVTAAIRSML